MCNNAEESTTEYCRYVPQEFSQTFTYDPLNRLASNTLGGVANQSWNLDSQGNWSSVTTNGVTQTETAKAQNQITSISGTAGTPVYDGNGNMTTDQSGNTYVYNAWNQLVAVKNSTGAVIAQYTYDSRGYRISETYPQGGTGIPAGEINYIYYDSQWQAIEIRTNGTASSNVTSQIVWSAAYINATVLQDAYSAGVIQPNSRLYFEQDAIWDTTAVVGYNATSGTWNVVQRFTYSPYGTITILNADWSTPASGTLPLVNNLYQGMTLDSVTGLYYERNRNYSPSLGTWTSQDPLKYINGADTYQFVMGNPVGHHDAFGLEASSSLGGNLFQSAWSGLGDFLSTPAGQAALNKLYGFGLGHLTPTGPNTGPGFPGVPKPGGGISFCPYNFKFPNGNIKFNIGSGLGYGFPFDINASPYVNGIFNYGNFNAWLQAQGLLNYNNSQFGAGGIISGGVGWGPFFVDMQVGTGTPVYGGGLRFGF